MLWMVFPAFEAGTWIGWLSSRFGSGARRRERFIHGSKALVSIPIIDQQLEREVMFSSKNHRRVASGVARGIRLLVNTRAFELLLVKFFSEYRRKKLELVEKVVIHV